MKHFYQCLILASLFTLANVRAQPTETKLTVSEFSNDNFGISVATDGNYLVAGAPTAEEGKDAFTQIRTNGFSVF